MKRTKLHIPRNLEDLSSRAKTGVSLHSHTEHSKESLAFLPYYGSKIPLVSYLWKKETAKYHEKEGKEINFSTAFWNPPLDAHSVYDGEKKQINEAGLDAIVSLTDHDTIDGSLKVVQLPDNSNAPISLEWTVPYDFGFFHVGVHNLPRENAVELTKTLLDLTFVKENWINEKRDEMFSMLNDLPGVLLILNHPLWDIEMVGKESHELLLNDFLKAHGRWIHALEINGFRSWSENKAVIELSEAVDMPIATGGDRHGCKPNTVINLTNASTFEEFVNEVRIDKRSEVALMPEYEQPLNSRRFQSIGEILQSYPDFLKARRRWFDRMYFDVNDGQGLVPISSNGWGLGEPKWVRRAVWTLRFLGGSRIRPLFRVLRKAVDSVPRDIETSRIVDRDEGKVSPSIFSNTT
ncbi:MAG: hypothetical protein IPI64_11395 [Chloracidobacterium sp.]|nr:hypothetical protein [Chloracidobacterium sp.]